MNPLSFLALPNVDHRLAPGPNKAQTKPLWYTVEFKFYAVAFVLVVPLMIKTAMDISSPEHKNYQLYAGLLSKGWIPGREVDNSDAQYKFFRDNLPLLLVLMFAHVGVRRGVEYLTHCYRLTFDFWFGLVFIAAVHGVNSVKILIHVIICYGITRGLQFQTSWAKIGLWTYGIASLFINDKYRMFKLGDLWGPLSMLDPGFKGIVARWDVFYNFTLLRVLSFNLDYLNALYPQNKKTDEKPRSEEFQRVNNNLPLEDYSLQNYFAYLFYAPLFIAGPILTFNDFVRQSRQSLPSINLKTLMNYSLLFTVCVLNMELILHFIYVVAISKRKAWIGDTPFQISMIGLVNLNIIWLKLLIPWRFFRLWSLLDGIDPPENMIRCVDNNYSALAFWKGWHRSYNKFVVKYVYIPLGGASNRILASLAVFSFVAIWHDIELRLLFWGWLIVLFLLPEFFISTYCAQFSQEWWYRHLCAVGGVLNIWLMMVANLYGFCLGNDGIVALFKEMFSTLDGLVFFTLANVSLFIAVQVMFELREEEKRHGIDVKC
jgi:D-alanyl-lipoteichoic acid acyltransferase DltB (MBOAT superfamily)